MCIPVPRRPNFSIDTEIVAVWSKVLKNLMSNMHGMVPNIVAFGKWLKSSAGNVKYKDSLDLVKAELSSTESNLRIIKNYAVVLTAVREVRLKNVFFFSFILIFIQPGTFIYARRLFMILQTINFPWAFTSETYVIPHCIVLYCIVF